MDFKIDTTLNIEGIIAAIAVLGAAIGFLLNLAKNWLYEYKDKRYRGTNSIILDLLEQNFENGLSEEELWNLYSSNDTLLKRKEFKAFSPNKISRYGFEGQLKHLQSNFLIRLTGPAHYHIDFREPKDWKRFYQVNTYRQMVEHIENEVGQIELNKILNSVISPSFYRSTAAQTYLIDKGDSVAISNLILDLKNTDMNIRQKAAEHFIELNEQCNRY